MVSMDVVTECTRQGILVIKLLPLEGPLGGGGVGRGFALSHIDGKRHIVMNAGHCIV